MVRRLIKSKNALAAPIGNLIIILAAVILTTTVVLFATNVTTSQLQKEKMYIITSHVWYVNSNSSIAGVAICNTGPSDIVLTQLNVKGLQCQWNGTSNYVLYCKINGTLPGDLSLVTNLTNSGTNTIPIAGIPCAFDVAGEGLTIKSGMTIAFYTVIPDRIMIYDLATPVRIVITTTQAVYCTETLVQTA